MDLNNQSNPSQPNNLPQDPSGQPDRPTGAPHQDTVNTGPPADLAPPPRGTAPGPQVQQATTSGQAGGVEAGSDPLLRPRSPSKRKPPPQYLPGVPTAAVDKPIPPVDQPIPDGPPSSFYKAPPNADAWRQPDNGPPTGSTQSSFPFPPTGPDAQTGMTPTPSVYGDPAMDRLVLQAAAIAGAANYGAHMAAAQHGQPNPFGPRPTGPPPPPEPTPSQPPRGKQARMTDEERAARKRANDERLKNTVDESNNAPSPTKPNPADSQQDEASDTSSGGSRYYMERIWPMRVFTYGPHRTYDQALRRKWAFDDNHLPAEQSALRQSRDQTPPG